MGFLQAQHSLDRAEIDQNPVGEQGLDQSLAGGADARGLAQAPFGVPKTPGQRLGRQMVGNGRAGTGTGQAWMAGHLLVVAIEVDQAVARLEPEGLADPAEGDGIQAALELDVGVAMHLDLGPHRQHRWDLGQGLQQGALGR